MAWTEPRTWVDGELEAGAVLNTHIRDNFLAIGPIMRVVKQLSENVASNITPQADDELFFPVAVNEDWIFNFGIKVLGNGTNDLRFNITAPSGTSLNWWQVPGITTAGAFAESPPGAAEMQTDAPASGSGFLITGTALVGATPGNITLTWAQVSSSATNTTIGGGSYLVAWRT